MDLQYIATIVISFCIGALIVFLVMRGRFAAEIASATEKASRLEPVELELVSTRGEVSRLLVQVAELSANLNFEREQTAGKIQLLLDAKTALTDQFKNLANDILEEKTQKFTEQNQTALGQLLNPLKQKLTEFQTRVELVYDTENKDRAALKQQVLQLMELNQVLSEDAKNLTRALTGSSKTQGNWGEMVLESILEKSGLRQGQEYEVQESYKREDGTRGVPDVVVHLPGQRQLVVDSKVSLTAYTEFEQEENEEARLAALHRHLDSIRGHISELSGKNYQALYGLKSLDFVLMFVPVEPAFLLALKHDRDVFMDAYKRNVLLVCPTTLMFVIGTVAHLWRQEAQTRNAQEIAKRGADLYDRLCAFVTDLEMIGERLTQAQASYTNAHNKLSKNKGNVIWQAEKLKELGVKPSKTLPASLAETARPDSDPVANSLGISLDENGHTPDIPEN